jgi:hypothetical protein
MSHDLKSLMLICNGIEDGQDQFNDPSFTYDHGQLCRKIDDINRERFCGLDTIVDFPSEFGNPEALAIRHEQELGCPLAISDWP